MHEQTLKRLEFDKILDCLASFCSSEIGQELVFSLRPMTDQAFILQNQAQTTEGRELLRIEPMADLSGWPDVRREIRRAQQGGILEPGELLAVGQVMKACRKCKNFFLGRRERYPLLAEIGLAIGNFLNVEKKVFSVVLPGPEISDHASPELFSIRRKQAQLQQEIKKQLDNLIRLAAFQKYLQEPLVTMREGRYVVPVKQECRSSVPGIIHDQSASGATVFLEPLAVVEANNEIRRLQVAEKQEINKILTALSALVAARAEELTASLGYLGQLDFILAKARYSQVLNACQPEIDSRKPFLNIKGARHPLLTGNVVPSDVCLGENFHILVITGPNTGGKTVALKTAGLMVLMAQSGLHIPVQSGTRLGIFEHVFADIGDEQSIEQSLSTFSAHMKNIVHILREADARSLVLLDELGAGTDPTEGAALAQAVLEKLLNKGAKTIATTHYNELKNFAYRQQGIENASTEFDVVTLKPTYRLQTGRPGGSQAFEIALRLGAETDLIKRARDFLSKEQLNLADLIRQLEHDRQLIAQDREEARRLKKEALAIKERYAEVKKALLTRRQEFLRKAAQEARHLVWQTRREVEEIVQEIRVQVNEERIAEREKAIFEIRRKVKDISEGIIDHEPYVKRDEGKIPSEVKVGQEVYLPRYNQLGYVLAPTGDGHVQVQVGAIKLTLPLQELQISKESAPVQKLYSAVLGVEKAKEISASIDLRGLRAEEALLKVEKYLDGAILAGFSLVYLIHGKGTGALRAIIQEQLKNDQRVKSFRLGEHGEGGGGVTVVELAE